MSIIILLTNLTIALVLRGIVAGLAFVLSAKTFTDRNKLRPFECGFSSKDRARLPFSIRFFLIALIFLIFDVELVLLFPFFLALASSVAPLVFTILSVFVVVLTGGLYYEWGNGILE